MKDELARWVRGLGARTSDVTRDVVETPLRVVPAKRKTRLAVEDLPLEATHLEINGRPFHVVLRDAKVYMAYRTPSGADGIKRVKPHGAKAVALELARLVHASGCEWPDRNVALACNWPNVVAPPSSLVALRKATRGMARPPAMKKPFDGLERAAVAMAILPGDAVEVGVGHRTCYVLLEQNMVFMRMESWNASTAYLREITDLARKKRIVALAQLRPFPGLG